MWGPAALKLKDRDQWIGWHLTHQLERLKLVAQNRRFLLLHQRGAEPNLASQALAAATRALPEHWQQRFGYRPLLGESFTDPETFAGIRYKGYVNPFMHGHPPTEQMAAALKKSREYLNRLRRSPPSFTTVERL